MSPGQLTALTAAAGAVVPLLVLLVVLVRARRFRRRTEAELATAQGEIAGLKRRVEELTQQVVAASEAARERESTPAASTTPSTPAVRRDRDVEFVITTAGQPRPEEQPLPTVDARQFASAAVGESLVRLVSLGYGVRRALSAENRNRIAFEMRREVRRSRKGRRRELRDLRRRLRDVEAREDLERESAA